ncbi:SinI family restriction endonuclease [Klebsiella pneumoniae]
MLTGISFVANSEDLAKQIMDAINPELSSKFQYLVKFLSQFPETCSKPRGRKLQEKMGQIEHIEYLARNFSESRLPRKPMPPTTIPDEVVSIVLNISFNIPQEGVVSENGIYGHSRFCNTDFDDKLACLNLSGV